jgi:hypothetical protein
MGRTGTSGARRLVPSALIVAMFIALTVLVGLPVGSAAGSAAQGLRPAQTSAPPSGLSATVTWDGSNILSAANSTSAFSLHLDGTANLRYAWTASGSATYNINDARLQMFYFGFALSTRDVTQTDTSLATSGSFTMNWTTGAIAYALEGTYKLVASLLAPNGTTMWSQSFWVQVFAPYYLLAALPIVFLLIIIYEIYSVATVGKHAGLKVTKPGGSPPPPSGGTTAGGSTAPDTGTATAPDSASPPSGGGS